MLYEDSCRLGLHLYSIFNDQAVAKFMQYNSKSNSKIVPAIENTQKRYYLYNNINSVFNTKKQAVLASLLIAIKLCVYPEIMLSESIITQISLDEITCQTNHIKYMNSPLTVAILLSFLGDDTINDRYNYAHYVLQECEHPQTTLVKLRKKYLKEGIKQLKKNKLFHYANFIDFKNFKLKDVKSNHISHSINPTNLRRTSHSKKYLTYQKTKGN